MSIEETAERLADYSMMLVEGILKQPSASSIGKLCNDLSRHYRALGISSLLMTADRDDFCYGLAQSALTRKYYLQRCAAEGISGDPAMKASFVDPLQDAITIGLSGLAVEIDGLGPSEWMREYEYEEDFAYGRFLGKMASPAEGRERDAMSLLMRYETACEGNTGPRLDTCRAIVKRDQAGFESAFSALLLERGQRMSELSDKKLDSILAQAYTFGPNQHVFVEGLALLRLAEDAGLHTEDEYPSCPGIVRRIRRFKFVPRSFPNLPLVG